MASNKHIEHIGDTQANIRTELDVLQIAIFTDQSENFVYQNAADNKLYKTANQSYWNGATTTYCDADFKELTVNDDLNIDEYIYRDDDNADYIRLEANKATIALDSTVAWTFEDDKTYSVLDCGIGVSPSYKLDVADNTSMIMAESKYSADASGSAFYFQKSRHATVGSHTVVQDNDQLGVINFKGSDGTDFGTTSARIISLVDDASPAASSIGGDLGFYTAAGLASDDLTLRMLINSSGILSLDNAAPPAWKVATYPAVMMYEDLGSVSYNSTGESFEHGVNTYFASNDAYKYIESDFASLLVQTQSGNFVFNRAASGTAGNDISWIGLLTMSSAGAVFNEGGEAGHDFRVESDTNENMLKIDAGNNELGIGMAPTELVSIGTSTVNFHIIDAQETGFTYDTACDARLQCKFGSNTYYIPAETVA